MLRAITRRRRHSLPKTSTSPRESRKGGAEPMTDKKKGLTPEELEAQTGEALPDREEMSLVNANLAAPVNAAVAANVLSDDSVAFANAQQDATFDQHN